MEIESMVLNLIAKLKVEQGKIDQYVKDQIEKALNFYQQEASGKSGRIPSIQINKIHNLIAEAKRELHGIPPLNSEHDITPKSDSEIYKMKEYFSELGKSLNSGKIKPEDCKGILNEAIYKGIQIDRSTKPFTGKQLPFVAIVFLKLFLNSAHTKVTVNLDQILSALQTSCQNISTLNVRSIDQSDVKKVKEQLAGIRKTLESFNAAAAQTRSHIEHKVNCRN